MTELSDAVEQDPELSIGRSKRVKAKKTRAPSPLSHWRAMKYAFTRARRFVGPSNKLAIELDSAIKSLDVTIQAWKELESR